MVVSKASKVLCLVLILALCFTFIAPRPVAHAEGLTISAIAAILVMIAGAAGVALSFDSASGQSVQGWMEGQIGRYSSSIGIPVVDLFVNIRQAFYRSATRQLVLAAGAVQEAFDFFGNFADSFSLSSTPISVLSNSDYPVYIGSWPSTTIKNTYEEIVSLYSFPLTPIPFSGSFSVTLDPSDSSTVVFTSGSLTASFRTVSGCTPLDFVIIKHRNAIAASFILQLSDGRYESFTASNTGFFSSVFTSASASLPTGSVAPTPTYQSGEGMGLTYGGADAGTLDDFLTTGLEGAGAGTLDVTTTTVPFDEPIPTVGPAGSTTWDDGSLGFWDGLTGSISAGLTAAGAQVRTWVNTITAPITQAVEAVQSWTQSVFDTSAVAVTDFSIPNLKNFFPFCIPFDIYDMLHLFAATRAAPVIDWTFDFGSIGSYDLTIDLSAWDGAAQVLRACELVAFSVGLALITRRLIGG